MQFDAVAFLTGLYADPGMAGDSVPESADTLADLTPDQLPDGWREWYEERAAIREYDGGQAREHAEAEAMRETIAAMQVAGQSDFAPPE